MNMAMETLNIKYTTIVLLFIPLFFISDVFVAILNRIGSDFYRVSIFSRIVFLFLCLKYISCRINNSKLQEVMLFSILFILFSILGNGLYSIRVEGYDYLENFITLWKYIFFPLTYYFIYNIFKNSKEAQQKLFKLYEIIIIIYSLSILIGVIFKINFFLTYGEYRFGYKGVFFAQNVASAFYLIALFYSLYAFVYEHKKFLLILVSIAAPLIGTKVGLIIPFIAILFCLFFYNKKVRYISVIILFFFAFFIIVLFLMNDGFVDVFMFDKLSRSKLVTYYQQAIERYGFLTMIFSGRNIYIIEKFLPNIRNNWNFFNYLFGGVDLMQFGTETDLIDLFSFTGLFGTMLYIVMLLKIFISKKYLLFSLIFFVLYVAVASVAGHFFTAALNAVYLSITILKYKCNTKTI